MPAKWPLNTLQTSVGGSRFPRGLRLRKRREFLEVQSEGKKVHTHHFVILVRPAPGEAGGAPGRLGITISKRIGNAVTRNRLKRLVREFVRQARGRGVVFVPSGCEAVVIAKRSAADIDFAELSRDLSRHRNKVAALC